MADANQQAQELAQTMAKLNEEMALYGRTTAQTEQAKTDANMKAKYGIENFSAGTSQAAKSLEALGGAGIAAGKAMLEGKKGAAAFNSSLDGLATAVQAAGAALALLVPVIGPLVAIVTAAGVALIKYGKAANEMADKLHAGYRGLAQSGAAASDGMTGLKVGAQKLSLTMDELSDYVQLVAENSQDLANFGGTVYKGRQAFENIGKALEPAQKGFLAMGLMPKDIAEGMAGYLRTQTRLGNAQRMTTDQLAAGVRGYLIEQDALTKLTGVNRKEAEKMQEAALTEEQHAGMVRKLQLAGRKDEADNMIAVSSAANRLNPELGKLVRALQTGNLSSEAARKLNISAPGAMRALELGTKGVLKPMEVMDQIVKELAATGDDIGAELAPYSAFNQTFVDMGMIQELRIKREKGLQQTLDETEKELKRQGATGKKAADQLVENQTNLVKAQIEANKVMTDFIFKGIGPAQDAMRVLATATMKAGNLLDQFTPGGSKLSGTTKEVASTVGGAGIGAGTGAIVGGLIGLLGGPGGALLGAKLGTVIGTGIGGYLLKNTAGELIDNAQGTKPPEARAVGGPVSKSTPYLVGEDGPEIFVPKAAGDIVPNNKLSTGAAIGGNFSAAIDQMFESVKTQEKIVDVDTVRMQQFSDLQKNYFDTYGGFMKDMTEQATANDPKDVSSKVGRMFSNIFGGNSELQIPKASNLTGMSDNFYKAVEETLKDVKTQEKILDVDTVRMKKFSDLQKNYFDTYGGYMKDVIEQIEDNDPKDENSNIGQMFKLSSIFGSMSPQMTEAFRASTKGNMGSGTGSPTPQASNMTNMSGVGTGVGQGLKSNMTNMSGSGTGGGQGLKGPEEHSAVGGGGQGLKGPPKLVSVRSKTGKSAEVNAEYAPRFQSLIDYLDSIGYEINSLGGYIDRDVRGRPGVKSVHAHGAAIDINPGANPMGGQLVTDLPENISSIAKGLGLGWGGNWASIKDAMHFSVAANEGGDIKLSDGGVAVGPNSGYPATLHGEEAVIPLNNGGGNFVKLFESMADSNSRMVGMLEELVRAQKNGNDISSKMLRMQT